MTRRAFGRIRALGLLGGGVLIALAALLLVLATGDAWRRPLSAPPTSKPVLTPPPPTSSPTAEPTATPTSVWAAKARQVTQPSATAPPVALIPQVVDQRAAVRAARVRVVHAAAGLGAIRIFVNGAPIGQTLSFPAISPYVEVPMGQLRIEGRATADGKRAWATLLDAAAGQDYSVAVAQTEHDVHVLHLLDDNTLPGYREIRLRIVNLLNPQASAEIERDLPASATIAMPSFGRTSKYLAMYIHPRSTPILQGNPGHDDAQDWTMGTVYTVWVISGESSRSVRAISEDAYLDYPLLPETGALGKFGRTHAHCA